MDPEIDQRSATGHLLGCEPATETRNAGPAHPEPTGMVDLAEVPAFDFALDQLHVLPAAPIEHDPQHPIGAPSGGDDLFSFLARGRQRLFDHHMLAGLERGQRDRKVQDVRNGDCDGFDIRVSHEILVVPIDTWHAELCGQRLTPLRVESGNCDNFRSWNFGEALQMQQADAAADDSDPKLPRVFQPTPSSAGPTPEHHTYAVEETPGLRLLYTSVIIVTSGGHRNRTGGRKTPTPRDV